jgi:pimeloyl-ACP methyl ester carboxylesterase
VISSVAGVAAAGLILGTGGLALDRMALRMIRPPFKPLRRKASRLPFPSDAITISSGGQALKGWMLRPEKDNGGPVLVMVHGWGSNHGTMTLLAEPLLGSGYPVLLFDVRHHGKSRGAPYVTARHFRDDIFAAIREVGEHYPGRPRVLVGHSMGGSTGVVAVAEGAPVQGLVSIGAPADLWEVWAFHLDQKGLPGKWVVRALSPFWRFRAGVPWNTLDPRRRAKELKVPFLILHGEEDESVPAGHARLLARAGGVKPRILPGQGHTDLLESPELHNEVVEFLENLTG